MTAFNQTRRWRHPDQLSVAQEILTSTFPSTIIEELFNKQYDFPRYKRESEHGIPLSSDVVPHGLMESR